MRLLFAALCFVAACNKDGVSSDKEAKQAYLGLDAHIEKAIQLGFDGFNSASSANISPQTTTGTVKGTITVTGQVDQGASNNKEMNLHEKLDGYSDDGKIVYDTNDAALPAIGLSLKKIPDGTLTGTIAGDYQMSGDLKGTVTLSLTLSATLQPKATDATKVERKPGTTHVVGTAVSGDGTFDVDVTR